MFRYLRISTAVLIFCATSTMAATFTGTETFRSPDDLTLIDTGGAVPLAFLDLSATDGMDITQALAAFGGDGFRVANVPEMTDLLSAFGLPTPTADVSTWDLDSLDAPLAAVSAFQSFLGLSNTTVTDTYSGGFIDDGLADGEAALVNVRSENTGSVFVNHVDINGGGDAGAPVATLGVFLVRDGTDGLSAVPLPGSGVALGLGLIALRRWSRG